MATITYYDGTNVNFKAATGYVARYRSQFTAQNGAVWVVEIIDTDTSSSHGFSFSESTPKAFALGEDGFTFSMDGKDDRFESGPITTECTIDMIMDENDHFDLVNVIEGSDDHRFILGLYSLTVPTASTFDNDDTLYATPVWFGIISNEDMEWDPQNLHSSMRITARCGLALLNDLEYVDDNGDRFTGYQRVTKHIHNCLSKLPHWGLYGYISYGLGTPYGFGAFFSINRPAITLENTFIAKDEHTVPVGNTFNVTHNSFYNTKVASEIFYDIEHDEDFLGGDVVRVETLSCGDVLKEICSTFQLRFYQYLGGWIGDCPLAMEAEDMRQFYTYWDPSHLGSDANARHQMSLQQAATSRFRLYEAGYEYLDTLQDSFLFPVKGAKSIHKNAGSQVFVRGQNQGPGVTDSYAVLASNRSGYTGSTEVLENPTATVASEGVLTMRGDFKLLEMGYNGLPGNGGQNVDLSYVGMKPIVKMKIKVGEYYLKRSLILSSDTYNIQRTAASDLTYTPHIQSGAVEWTTVESTYDFMALIPGAEQPPATLYDEDNDVDVLGGLHIALHDNEEEFKYASGLLGAGTQHSQVTFEIDWQLPELPSVTGAHEGVEFSAELTYYERDSNTELTYGASNSTGLNDIHAARIQNFKLMSGDSEEEGDVVFHESQESSYSTVIANESLIGDSYGGSNIGDGTIQIQDGQDSSYSFSGQSWVPAWRRNEDPAVSKKYLHDVVATQNLQMRSKTLRQRNCTIFHPSVTDYAKIQYPGPSTNFDIEGNSDARKIPFPACRFEEVIPSTSDELKFLITSLTMTAKTCTFDLGLILYDVDYDMTITSDDNADDIVRGGGQGSGGSDSIGIAGGKQGIVEQIRKEAQRAIQAKNVTDFISTDSEGITSIQVSSLIDFDTGDAAAFFGGSSGGAAARSGYSNSRIVMIDENGGMEEIAPGTKGNYLVSGGTTHDPSFNALSVPIASLSGRVSSIYPNSFYYGSSSYGWNYPIWQSITFSDAKGNPYARQISDDYAHCGILCCENYSQIRVRGSIRNDSSTDNLKVMLLQGTPPDGSSSNISLTKLGEEAITISTQDRHYDVDFTTTVEANSGKLLFVGIAKTGGTTTTRYLNFTLTLYGTKK